MNLTLITPCSRPQNLKAVADSIDFSKIKQWIIVYDTSRVHIKEKQFLGNRKVSEFFENAEEHGVVSVYGNFQRFVALNKVTDGYVFFLDDDNRLLPDFLPTIEAYLDVPDKWYSFDVMCRGDKKNLIKGDSVQQDSASICVDISIVRKFNACWGGVNGSCMNGRGADNNFIRQLRMNAAEHHHYIPKNLAAHNQLNRPV